jgi:hypothetical protein
MWPSGTLVGSSSVGGDVLTITFSANARNVNLKTALEAIYGTITTAVDVVATQNAGVLFDSDSATAAFRTGGLPIGSTIRLNFYGRCGGKGGDAGDGGSSGNDGQPGQPGRDAVSLDDDVTVDLSTTGQFFGGGGGGGGGSDRGGGGGGGQGDEGGAKGLKGNALAQDGTAGSPSANGVGGDGHPSGGGKGGKGGGWGSAGAKGGNGSGGGSGGNPGAAGKAINLNGHTVTWIAGNNTTQVKGSVS